jgi:hypothetical protein
MRTVIILAIGIYIGRQLWRSFDRSNYEAWIKPKLLKMLESHGITKDEAEKEVRKVLQK